MTNDNHTRKKANAVFFSVIMVISMAAVGFAAAPAAAQGNTDITVNDVTVDNTVQNEEAQYDVTTTFDDVDDSDPDAKIVRLDFDGEPGNLGDITDGDVTVTLDGGEETVDDVEQALTSSTLLITLSGEIEFDSVNDGEELEVTVEGVENADAGEYDFTVGLHEANQDLITEDTLTDAYEIGDGATALDADRYFADTNALYDDTLVWQGQVVGVGDLDANADVQLRERVSDSQTRLRDELSTNENGQVTFETADRSEGDYFLRGAGAGGSGVPNVGETFEISVQDLDVDFDADEVNMPC